MTNVIFTIFSNFTRMRWGVRWMINVIFTIFTWVEDRGERRGDAVDGLMTNVILTIFTHIGGGWVLHGCIMLFSLFSLALWGGGGAGVMLMIY